MPWKQTTHSEVAARLKMRGFELQEPYKPYHALILTRCLTCNYEWRVRPDSIAGGGGCPKCSKALPLAHNEVVDRFTARGLEMLDEFTTSHVKVLTRCKQCRYEWRVLPHSVAQGVGCPKCAKVARVTQLEAEKRFNAVGLEIVGTWRNISTKVKARCRKCAYEWQVLPSNVSVGGGCPRCADHTFKSDKPAILYYLKVSNPFGDPVYKIGITNRTIKKRFQNELSKIMIIEIWNFDTGAEAFEMEQDILHDYDADRYDGPDILEGGNDELFNFDVLGLDTGRTRQLELVA